MSRRAPGWLLLDLLAVVLFAAVGRRSHDESSAVLGVLVTAWPAAETSLPAPATVLQAETARPAATTAMITILRICALRSLAMGFRSV